MIINPYVYAGGFDPDAQAFITAAGITDNTQKTAINTLVLDMKGYGIWTKMKAIYPMVGGTATTHKFNLKNPLDTDAAFRLSFLGGWTHNSDGITGNAANTYAETFLTPNISLSQNNTHISIYSRTNSNINGVDMGTNDNPSGQVNTTKVQTRWSDGNCYYAINSGIQSQFVNSNSTGHYIVNRVSATAQMIFRNNVKNTSLSNVENLCSRSIWIGAWNNSIGSSFYTNRNYAFASIGDGLTDTEAGNFYTAVQAFNTTLGRQV